jgi:hypothetical protein
MQKPLKYLLYFSAGYTLTSIIASFIAGSTQKAFAIMSFSAPVLWLFWLFCVFHTRKIADTGLTLCFLWILIDLGIFVNFIGLEVGSATSEEWDHFAVALMYFPVIFPIGLIWPSISSLFEHQSYAFNLLLDIEINTPWKIAIEGWLDMSFIALIQSLIFYHLVRSTDAVVGKALSWLAARRKT